MTFAIIGVLEILLAIFLSFRWKTNLTRFELARRAERDKKFRAEKRFSEIYRGIWLLMRLAALIVAIFLTVFAAQFWGIVGGSAISFGAIILATFLAHAFKKPAQSLIEKQFNWFNKYFAFCEILSRISFPGDEPRIFSREELENLISRGDFLEEADKIFMKKALNFRAKIVREIMTPREKIIFVNAKDSLTPKFLDEIFATGHQIFPVVNGDLDKSVGLLFREDVMEVSREENLVSEKMRKLPAIVESSLALDEVFAKMCETHSTMLIVAKNNSVVGLVTLADLAKYLLV